LFEHVEVLNAVAARGAAPIIETVPLPSGAQFLNVIESVFSGMARAIIHNSDYQTLDDAKTAINRYFEARNAHFRQHPRRAGKKIWGKERAPATFSEANNCKGSTLPVTVATCLGHRSKRILKRAPAMVVSSTILDGLLTAA
jgi:hypothetical protein